MKYPKTQIPRDPNGGADAPDEDAFWGPENGATELHDEVTLTRPYDLEERTAQFGEAIIHFAKEIPGNAVTYRLIPQFVGAGPSLGANYCEADLRPKARVLWLEARELHLIFLLAVSETEMTGNSQIPKYPNTQTPRSNWLGYFDTCP